MALPVWPKHMATFEDLLKGMVEEYLEQYGPSESPRLVYSLGIYPNTYYVLSDGTYRRPLSAQNETLETLPAVTLEEIAPDKKALIKILDSAITHIAFTKNRWECEEGGRPNLAAEELLRKMRSLRTQVYDSLQ